MALGTKRKEVTSVKYTVYSLRGGQAGGGGKMRSDEMSSSNKPVSVTYLFSEVNLLDILR